MFDFFIEENDPGSKLKPKDSDKENKEVVINRLAFLKKGTKKYKFTLEAEMGLNTLYSKTIIDNFWILQVLDISDQGYIIDLVNYDVQLRECNNEGFKEMFHVTRQFQKLYDEIRVTIDKEGNLIKVMNAQRMGDRWKQIKKETISYFNDGTDLDEFFAIKEDEFYKPEFLQKIVREVEFFFIYLQVPGYGRKIKQWNNSEIKRDNAYRTEQIRWVLDLSGRKEIITDSPLGQINVKSVFETNNKWLQRGYGNMPFVKVEELKPDFSLKGEYQFYNKSGWLKRAKVLVNEIAHPKNLYHKMNYLIEEIE